MHEIKRLFALAALLACGSFPLAAASDTPFTAKYTVGPGDILTIDVVGMKGFTVSCRVSNSGKVHVPRLGILKVDSLTLSEVGRKIEEEYKSREMLRDPTVTVEVHQSRARPVYILGEVMMPGQFVINEKMNVLDLITLSGGMNEVAGEMGYLYRRRTDQSASAEAAAKPGVEFVESTVDEAIPIYFDRLYEGTEEVGNIDLVAGDVLYVPERVEKYFYVVGDVVSPGQQMIPPGEKVKITRALGMASGPTKTSKLRKGILAWRTEDGSFDHKQVDLRAILQGEEPDFEVNPGDILFVPGSAAKSLAVGMLNAIPGFALQN